MNETHNAEMPSLRAAIRRIQELEERIARLEDHTRGIPVRFGGGGGTLSDHVHNRSGDGGILELENTRMKSTVEGDEDHVGVFGMYWEETLTGMEDGCWCAIRALWG